MSDKNKGGVLHQDANDLKEHLKELCLRCPPQEGELLDRRALRDALSVIFADPAKEGAHGKRN